jgi:hypothetical protein
MNLRIALGVILAFCIIGAFLTAGCDNGALSGKGQTGTLRVLITDKPYPIDLIEEAWITIESVEVHRVGVDDDVDGTIETDEDGEIEETGKDVDADGGDAVDGDGDDGGWIVVPNEVEDFDLLQLRNGVTELLGEMDLETGTYNQVRLIVTKGRIVLKDPNAEENGGDESGDGIGIDSVESEALPCDEDPLCFDLTVPSGSQTGIKLHFKFEVESGKMTTLLLDVDVREVFQPVPGGDIDDPSSIREFKFRPSLGMRLIQLEEAGSISGAVTNTDGAGVEGVSVTVSADGSDVAGGSTDENGAYAVIGLAAGEYEVKFLHNDYVEPAPKAVVVNAGETTNVDAVLELVP